MGLIEYYYSSLKNNVEFKATEVIVTYLILIFDTRCWHKGKYRNLNLFYESERSNLSF